MIDDDRLFEKDFINGLKNRVRDEVYREVDEGLIRRKKDSQVWGADEEFNYERAAGILASTGIPQPVKLRTYLGYAQQYGNNVWIYAAVFLKATSIASVPLKLYKRKWKTTLTRDIFTDKNHHLVKVFATPNPFMSPFDFKEALIAGLELTGNAYIEEVVNRAGKLIEMYPLQPHKIEVIPNSKNFIEGYIYYGTGGKEIRFDADEITQIKYFNPLSDFYGMSPQSPAEMSVSTDNYSREWNRNFFKNSALPRGALETEQELNDPVVRRLKHDWKRVHRGVAKAHDIAVLEGGLKWRSIESSIKDADFVNLSLKNRDEILMDFGVYPGLLGLVENINNSTLENLKKMFWENTLLPIMEKLESAININLIWPYDETVYAAFDKDSIEALKGSQETRARIAAMLVDRGIMTQNEVREKYFGLPEVGWGKTWYMPLNLVPVDKAGQGLGVGNGQDGDQVPGRVIGRPPVSQEDMAGKQFMEAMRVSYMLGYKEGALQKKGESVDNNEVGMIDYNSGRKDETIEESRKKEEIDEQ